MKETSISYIGSGSHLSPAVRNRQVCTIVCHVVAPAGSDRGGNNLVHPEASRARLDITSSRGGAGAPGSSGPSGIGSPDTEGTCDDRDRGKGSNWFPRVPLVDKSSGTS